LAVDASRHDHGIGAALLNDALARVVRAAEQVAVRAVVVHAVDDNAAAFYEQFGFRALSSMPRTLMISLVGLRAAGF
jgi:GNAT superfamily N-acetyltransferase